MQILDKCKANVSMPDDMNTLTSKIDSVLGEHKVVEMLSGEIIHRWEFIGKYKLLWQVNVKEDIKGDGKTSLAVETVSILDSDKATFKDYMRYFGIGVIDTVLYIAIILLLYFLTVNTVGNWFNFVEIVNIIITLLLYSVVYVIYGNMSKIKRESIALDVIEELVGKLDQ